MSRRIDHVDGVVVAVGVEVLRPRVRGGAGIGILREEPGGGGVVVPGVHVEQAGGVRYAPRERHLVEKRVPRAGRHAELVVVVRLDDGTCPIHDVRDAPAHVVPVEEVVVRIRVLLRLRLPLEPLARHNRARWVEDVLRLQHVLVHRREQQRRARVVEVRNDLVLYTRHALTGWRKYPPAARSVIAPPEWYACSFQFFGRTSILVCFFFLRVFFYRFSK